MKKKVFEGLKILLVEEEALIAMDIEQLCYDLGAAAVATISSETKLSSDALDSVEAQAQMLGADAAILDAKVGGGWTTELARRLTQHGIPFVFATGYSSGEAFFAEFPNVPVVSKPYTGDELVGAVLTAVERTGSHHRG
ncbi:response regulator [Chelativorans sp. J32]|uniref:response regulator n=1 Tax=Chelativorans sp. J32 TaxID=935840 RepID=UPI0004B3DDA6|nr:response regulator [Chelativorans sp. J32]